MTAQHLRIVTNTPRVCLKGRSCVGENALQARGRPKARMSEAGVATVEAEFATLAAQLAAVGKLRNS